MQDRVTKSQQCWVKTQKNLYIDPNPQVFDYFNNFDVLVCKKMKIKPLVKNKLDIAFHCGTQNISRMS